MRDIAGDDSDVSVSMELDPRNKESRGKEYDLGVGTTDPPGRTASRMVNTKSLIAGGFQGGCAIQVDFFYEMLKENNQVR